MDEGFEERPGFVLIKALKCFIEFILEIDGLFDVRLDRPGALDDFLGCNVIAQAIIVVVTVREVVGVLVEGLPVFFENVVGSQGPQAPIEQDVDDLFGHRIHQKTGVFPFALF